MNFFKIIIKQFDDFLLDISYIVNHQLVKNLLPKKKLNHFPKKCNKSQLYYLKEKFIIFFLYMIPFKKIIIKYFCLNKDVIKENFQFNNLLKKYFN